MSLTDETQVRAACAFNDQLNQPWTQPLGHTAEDRPLEELLAEVRESAALPLAQSRTLPAGAYTSEAFFRWEEKQALRGEWQCVAHVSQLPQPGDFVIVDLLGEPLVVVLGTDHHLRVLSRACPHRGMDIMPPGFGHTEAVAREGAPGSGSTRHFLCPYHSWSFDLGGRLVACPAMEQAEGFTRGDWALREFRSEVLLGFVFVNLDGAAPQSPRMQWREVAAHLAKWTTQDLVVADVRTWGCPFNWKVITENFMESYHHVGAHSQSLQPIMPGRETWTESEHPHYIRCHLPYGEKERSAIAEAEARGEARETFPLIPGLTGRDRFEWGLVLGFPHWLLALAPDCLIWYRVLPVGPHRHTLQTTLLVPRATTTLPDYAERLQKAVAASVAFHLEDMEMCVGVQRSYYGTGYQRGRLSHLEMPIWLLQRYLAARSRETWPAQHGAAAPSQRPHE